MNLENLNTQVLKLLGLLTVVSMPAKAQDTSLLVDKNITINGVNVHYKTGGSGPYLLLLHGFTLTGEQWLPFAEELAEEYTLIIPDLPGHGRSEALGKQFRYDAVAELMRGLLLRLDIGTIQGIGHSAGSITLMHIAAQDPNILESMILVSGGHRFSAEGRKLLIEDRFEKADKAFQDYYLSIHPEGMPQISAIFEAMNDMARRHSTTADRAVLSPSVLAKIETPAFLIWGDRDPYFPVDVATELYQSLPNTRLWIIPKQHHVPIWAVWGGDKYSAERFVFEARIFFGYTKMNNK